MFDWVYLGNRIRIVREQRRLTQSCLAARMDISVNRLRQIEHGRAKIQVDQLAQLAEVLDVSMDYLATGRLENSKEMRPIVLNLDDCGTSMMRIVLYFREKRLVRSPFPAQRISRRRLCRESMIPRLAEWEETAW